MIKITFPDGSVREYENGISAYQIAMSISPRLASDVLAATVNGAVVDLERPITEDATLKLHKWEDEEAKKVFWHSSSHLMAEALEALYPGIKFGIGPAIDNGATVYLERNTAEVAVAFAPDAARMTRTWRGR